MGNVPVKGCPQEVELMANEFIRVCYRNHVLLTGFAFSDDPLFIMKFGTVTDTGESLTKLHKTLCDYINKANVKPSIVNPKVS